MSRSTATLLSKNGVTKNNEGHNKQEHNHEIPSTQPTRILPTLPDSFKSFTTPLKVESEEAKPIIQSLGNLLGITDYQTNMASFWFLDTLALHVLRHMKILDDYNRSILISWLAGEMKLIRDKKLSRDDFITIIKQLFYAVGEKMLQGETLLHWDSMADQPFMKELLSQNIISTSNNTVRKLEYSRHPKTILDAIIDSTYDMYAGELRYYLIYATFMEPLEMLTYHLPSVYRTPRRIKIAPRKDHVQKIVTKKLTSKREPERSEDSEISEIPRPQLSSLEDEEQRKLSRQFILPLIESNEAQNMINDLEGSEGRGVKVEEKR